MSRKTVLVELQADSHLTALMSRSARRCELLRAADAARDRLVGFLNEMRSHDEGLTIRGEHTIFPVIMITANERALDFLKTHHPPIVTAVHPADEEVDVHIPERESS